MSVRQLFAVLISVYLLGSMAWEVMADEPSSSTEFKVLKIGDEYIIAKGFNEKENFSAAIAEAKNRRIKVSITYDPWEPHWAIYVANQFYGTKATVHMKPFLAWDDEPGEKEVVELLKKSKPKAD